MSSEEAARKILTDMRVSFGKQRKFDWEGQDGNWDNNSWYDKDQDDDSWADNPQTKRKLSAQQQQVKASPAQAANPTHTKVRGGWQEPSSSSSSISPLEKSMAYITAKIHEMDTRVSSQIKVLPEDQKDTANDVKLMIQQVQAAYWYGVDQKREDAVTKIIVTGWRPYDTSYGKWGRAPLDYVALRRHQWFERTAAEKPGFTREETKKWSINAIHKGRLSNLLIVDTHCRTQWRDLLIRWKMELTEKGGNPKEDEVNSTT
jgi:hypothetical protein